MENQPEPIRPQPGPQEDCLACTADIVFFGGQAGGSKTFTVVMEGTRHVANPGFRAIYFRETRPQIRALGGLWDTSVRIFPAVGGHPSENVLIWRFPSGAQIKFDFLQREEDKYRHDGAQYALIVFDEVQHQTESQFWYVIGRANRSTCGVTPYVRATCNPDASSWIRQFIDWWIGPDGFAIPERSGVVRWFTRDQAGEIEWVDEAWAGPNGERPKSFTFIVAKVTDNVALMAANPEYLDSLRQLPPDERARLLDGNWNSRPEMRGMIYPEFDSVAHYIDQRRADYIEAEQLGNFQLYEGWDFGTGAGAATVVVWAYHDASADTLYIWDWTMGWEEPAAYFAQEVGLHGYRVQNRRSWEQHPDFRDNVTGKIPYERIGDPAGRQRESDQKHWFKRLADSFDIHLKPGVNKPTETIQTMRWALARQKIRLHPRLAERVQVGPRRAAGGREAKSFSDAFGEYVWNVAAGYDAARDGAKGGVNQPKKNWPSHPMDALGYIVRRIWGFRAPGATPRK